MSEKLKKPNHQILVVSFFYVKNTNRNSGKKQSEQYNESLCCINSISDSKIV